MISTPQVRPVSMQFSGERRDFRRLVVRGALLELVTAGFYRFWLATDMRRHLWSNTSIGGDAAEYTGRARELLIGFLFAVAILVPVYLAYFFAGLVAEEAQTFASTPLVLFFFVFGQFAIYRARRYRLTRTVWRGVRFWMTGSGWSYAGLATLWSLLVPVTLGLILPWRDAALERYKMRHSHFGDLQGSFVASGSALFKLGWWIWVLGAASVALAMVFATALRASGVLLLPFLVAPFLFAAYKAVQWRWWISGVRFGEVRFRSDLRAGALVGMYWKVVGWCLLLIALISALVLGGTMLLAAASGSPPEQFFSPDNITGNVAIVAPMVVSYLLLILSINVVIRMYLQRDVWQMVVQSVTVYGLETAADVAARGELAGALGEGFADSLDIGGL